MPFVTNQNANIYWDEQGTGEPLLLIMGLGYPLVMWHRSRPLLATRYRTITLENRGVGRSDMPAGPYTISLMASDAAAVLDATGIEAANVYGVSMGGMIAQEFALTYPHRVKTLILGCTAAGGPHAVRAEPEVTEFLTRHNHTPEEAVEVSVPFIYDSSTPRHLIDEDLVLRKQWLPNPAAYFAQLQGIISWESYSRLDQISCPTLVVHGESDQLIPLANARLIADRISGAQLITLPNAGHIYSTDQTALALSAIMNFLDEHNNQSLAG